MITTSSSLTHPSPILVTFFLFILVRALSIYLLRKFQVYNTMLLSINTILYVRAPELIHLLTENLYPLTNTSPFSPAPSLWQVLLYSLFLWILTFLDSTCKWDHIISVFLWLILLIIGASGSIHIVGNVSIFLSLRVE